MTYAGRQEHDPRVTRLLRDPDRLHRLGRNPSGLGVPMLGLLLKALTVQRARDDRWFRRWEKKYGRRPDPNGRTGDDGDNGS